MNATSDRPRIYINTLYVLSFVPGISGFQRWNERESEMMSGAELRKSHNRHRTGAAWSELDPAHGSEPRYWRRLDGRMPEFQDRVTTAQAVKAIKSDPWQRFALLNP